MSEFKKGAASLLRSRGLYIALALCLVAAGTVGYLTTLQRPAVETVVPEEVEVEVIKPPVTIPEIKKPLPAAPVITRRRRRRYRFPALRSCCPRWSRPWTAPPSPCFP